MDNENRIIAKLGAMDTTVNKVVAKLGAMDTTVNKVVAKLVEMDETLRTVQKDMVTKDGLRVAKSELMNHIDGFAKTHEKFDHELVAMKARMDRIEGVA